MRSELHINSFCNEIIIRLKITSHTSINYIFWNGVYIVFRGQKSALIRLNGVETPPPFAISFSSHYISLGMLTSYIRILCVSMNRPSNDLVITCCRLPSKLRYQFQVTSRGIHYGQNGTAAGTSPVSSFSHVHRHFTIASYSFIMTP
jgi:hypothetical protein